jgi:tetratricopeptide (TPR) repeat protein
MHIDPIDAKGWYDRGVVLLKENKRREALICFDRALELRPNFVDAWIERGDVAVDDDDALKCYDKAIDLDTKSAKAWNAKGLALYNSEGADAIISCYDRAIQADPNYVEAWYNKIMYFYRTGSWENAINCYNKAVSLNVRLPSIPWNSKDSLNTCPLPECFEGVLLCYDKAIEIDPNDIEAWYNKARALYYLDRDEEAIECCDRVLEINPRGGIALIEKDDFLLKLGLNLFSSGRYDLAIKCYDKALQIDASNTEAQNLKSIALAKLSQSSYNGPPYM